MSERPLGRCLIVNAYSYRNAGDAAIMLSTAKLLRDLGATSVAVSSRYDDTVAYGVFGLEVVKPVIPFPATGDGSRLSRLAVLVGGSAKAVVAIVTRGRLGARGIRAHYDTVVVAGGGYMYSAKRRFNMSLWHSLLSVRYGSAALQRVVMMPQSIGPITRRFDQKFVSWALSGVAVVVRETVSLAASRHRPQLPNVRVIDDVAFYPAVARRQRSTTSRPVLRLVAMDWTWSTSVAANRFDRYVEQMALLAELAANAGYFVVIGGHSMIREHDQDDVRVAQQIQQTARVNVEVDTDADVGHLYDEYVDAAVVVGTRLHSCIMALSVGTPAIGLSYQEKTVGVLAGVDHGAYVHSVDDFDPHEVFKQVQALAAMPREHWAELADRTKRSIFDQYEELAR